MGQGQGKHASMTSQSKGYLGTVDVEYLGAAQVKGEPTSLDALVGAFYEISRARIAARPVRIALPTTRESVCFLDVAARTELMKLDRTTLLCAVELPPAKFASAAAQGIVLLSTVDRLQKVAMCHALVCGGKAAELVDIVSDLVRLESGGGTRPSHTPDAAGMAIDRMKQQQGQRMAAYESKQHQMRLQQQQQEQLRRIAHLAHTNAMMGDAAASAMPQEPSYELFESTATPQVAPGQLLSPYTLNEDERAKEELERAKAKDAALALEKKNLVFDPYAEDGSAPLTPKMQDKFVRFHTYDWKKDKKYEQGTQAVVHKYNLDALPPARFQEELVKIRAHYYNKFIESFDLEAYRQWLAGSQQPFQGTAAPTGGAAGGVPAPMGGTLSGSMGAGMGGMGGTGVGMGMGMAPTGVYGTMPMQSMQMMQQPMMLPMQSMQMQAPQAMPQMYMQPQQQQQQYPWNGGNGSMMW